MKFGMAGPSANLKLDKQITDAVETAAEKDVRVLKIVTKGETLELDWCQTGNPSLENAFGAMRQHCVDAAPCLFLLRLQGAEDAPTEIRGTDVRWGLLSWSPDNAPVKAKMLIASSKKTIAQAITGLNAREYNMVEKDEDVNFKAFVEATRVLSHEERRDVMTSNERDIEDARNASERERRAMANQVKLLPGLGAINVQAEASFHSSLKEALAKGAKTAMLGKIVGETLHGECLPDITSPACLKGKLPETPCYVIMRIDDERVLFLVWTPEGANVKEKMKLTTFKANCAGMVTSEAPGVNIINAAAHDDDDLSDDIIKELAPEAEAPTVTPAAPTGPGGKKLPPGAVAMPGMMGMPMGMKLPPRVD